MNRADLVKKLHARLPFLLEREREALVTEMVDAFIRALISGRRIEIRGFGVFSVRVRNARRARNPRTMAIVSVPRKAVPFFRSGKHLLVRVNSCDSPAEKSASNRSRRSCVG